MINKKNIIFLIIIFSVVIVEISVTITAYYLLVDNNDSNTEKLMKESNKNMLSYIDLKMQEAIYVIKRNAAYFSLTDHYISTNNYIDLLQHENLPSKHNIESYMWIEKLKNEDLNRFENFCIENIRSDCMIKKLISYKDRTFERVSGKDYYYPLVFADPPFEGSLQKDLIGLDFASFIGTKDIIEIAESIPNITATYRITIPGVFQKNNPYSYGILLNYPSFKKINENNISQMIGIASAYIRVGDILQGAIDNLGLTITDNDIDIFVFDVTNDNYTINSDKNHSLIHRKNKPEYQSIWYPDNITETNIKIYKNEYPIATRMWNIYFKYNKVFIDKNESILIIIIPIVLANIFILLDILFIILYNLISSLKEKKELEEKKKNMSVQMLRYVNHEIRNPLNIIKGLSYFTFGKIKEFANCEGNTICIDRKILDMLISDLSTVCGSCDMVEHIVTDILDIDKLDSGKLNLNNEWIKIHDFINDIKKSISQKIDEKQTITLEKVYDKKLILFFDRYRMKQILLNFLTNSIKYTNNGKITIKIEEKENYYYFSISDTGRGIQEKDKNKIFNPFDLTSADDVSRYGGIGLGLYLCKMLVERMGGTIGFQSLYRSGSTFWVEFPKTIVKPINTNSDNIV